MSGHKMTLETQLVPFSLEGEVIYEQFIISMSYVCICKIPGALVRTYISMVTASNLFT